MLGPVGSLQARVLRPIGLAVAVLLALALAGTFCASPVIAAPAALVQGFGLSATPVGFRHTPSAASSTCVVRSLPSFVESSDTSVADLIEVACNPLVYSSGSKIKISAEQLNSQCGHTLSWAATYRGEPGPTNTNSITIELDADGNAAAVLWAGPGCASGESSISAQPLEGPYQKSTTSFTVLSPQTTPPGVTALPSSEIESAYNSSAATIVAVEFPRVYAGHHVHINARQLYSSCRQGPKLKWVGPHGTVLAASAESVNGVQLDNEGNAFVALFGLESCAPLTTVIEADLEETPFTTEATCFTIDAPRPGPSSPEGCPFGAPCSSASTTATLANFGAQICHFVSGETTIAQQQAALLEVAGHFPHVSQTGPNTWTVPAVTLLSALEAIPTSVAIELLKNAIAEGEDILKEILADKSGLKDLEEELPCTAKGIKSLKTAQEEDEKAVKADLDGARALIDVLKGASDGTTVSKVLGNIDDGSKGLVSKLTALEAALRQLSNECESTGDSAFLTEVSEDEQEVLTDINTVSSSQEYIAQTPTAGTVLLSGSGIINTSGTSDATAVTNQSDFSINSALPSDANPSGARGLIFSTQVSCGSLSLTSSLVTGCNSSNTASVNAGGWLTFSGSSFGSSINVGVSRSSTPVRLAVVTTNAEGSFSANVQIPADTEPGMHELYALGTAPDGSIQVLGIGITVAAPSTVATVPVEIPKLKLLGPSITASALPPPTIVNVTQSYRRWREGNTVAQISRTKSKLPRGTTFSFSLNEPASVSFAFTQQEAGRKVKGRCVAKTKKNRHRPACKRTITRGTLPFTGHAGINKVSFQGRLGGQKLRPGNYTLLITATSAAGHSSPQSLGFTIVK